jgi:hypothetical protein
MEIWKSIKNYESSYEVSSEGRVRSLDRMSQNGSGAIMINGKLLTISNSGRYSSISLSKDSKTKTFKVHRLVAEAFIPNPDNKPEVNHKKQPKTNNCVSNLEWNTKAENAKHAYDSGLLVTGEKNYNSILTESQVLAIRRLHRMNPNVSKLKISRKLNVSNSLIHNIINRVKWKHI